MKNNLTKLKMTKNACYDLPFLSSKIMNSVLKEISKELAKETKLLLLANKRDIQKIDKNSYIYDRASLSPERVRSMINQLLVVANLPSPLGIILEKKVLPNNLVLSKLSVPFGVIGVIFESRPNVLLEVFSLCFKSGNACILKGGSETKYTNEFLVKIIKKILVKHCLDSNIINLLSSTRESVKNMLQADKFIDVIIPRGSKNLIEYVRENSSIPIIETGAGVVHTYFDKTGDVELGARIIHNAKTRRHSVCNALDTLIINKHCLREIPKLAAKLQEKMVILYADVTAYKMLSKCYNHKLLKKAKATDFGKEFLSLSLSIKTVDSIKEAVDHINTYGSKHSEAIISSNQKNIEYFFSHVDAAVVYSNTSTSFTDGEQFGLGSEIGISTQKLHARGPLGLQALTSYKWIVRGAGQIRET